MLRKAKEIADKGEKEVDFMALALRCNQGCMIARGKEKAFFEEVNKNRPTKEFWEECGRLREKINQEFLDEINALMDKED